MKTLFDQLSGKRSWIIDAWYEKTIYVIGFVSTIIFLIGFINGLVESL